MTHEEWLAATDPISMLRFLQPRTSERKFRLYLCAGCRSIAHLFFHPVSLAAVEMAERFADGEATVEDLDRANWEAEVPTFGYDFRESTSDPAMRAEVLPRLIEMGVLPPTAEAGMEWQVEDAVRVRLLSAASLAEFCTSGSFSEPNWGLRHLPRVEWSGRWLADCVFGNPFHPVVMEPSWLDETVKGLAAAAYAKRSLPDGYLDTERLAVLSDALEDAGCDNADILAHCRGDSKHVRGCWVVDLLLGQS